MEIIALTDDGVILKTSNEEIRAMISSLTGEKPKEIKIGMRIPGIDYANTITSLKLLKENPAYVSLKNRIYDFNKYADKLKTEIDGFSISD